MKKSEVPQDNGRVAQKGSRELYYAIDENGEYTTALSTGWDAKNVVQDHTMEVLEQEIEASRQQVAQGLVSPILYFLRLKRMDLTVLSGYTGFWQWRIKRHLKPENFKKLNVRQLQKYADAFDISMEELKNYKG